MSVTYHDPCHLGRLGEPWIHWQGKKKQGQRLIYDPPKQLRRGTYGVYEPPREVLKSIPGLELKEMDRIKEYCWCCGAGGGVADTNLEYSMWTAQQRIEEAISTGTEALVSACPWCEKNFVHSIKENGNKLKIYDFVELLEQSI
jgi:Fe-S oxidoreductase